MTYQFVNASDYVYISYVILSNCQCKMVIRYDFRGFIGANNHDQESIMEKESVSGLMQKYGQKDGQRVRH